MTKKKKKKNKSFFSRKKKRLIRLFLLCLLATFAYALYNPDIIDNPKYREQAIKLRSQIIAYLDSSPLKQLDSLEPLIQRLASYQEYLPQGAVLGDQDIYIEEAFKKATQNLNQLPTQQLQRIKTEFCRDLNFSTATSASQP